MTKSLIKGRILFRTPGGLTLVNVGDDLTVLNFPETEPDELDVIEFEELFELENNVLMEASENLLSSDVSSTLARLVVESNVADMEDHNPNQCALYSKGNCKFGSKRNKKNANWIQCEIETCGKWYHQDCVGVSFKSAKDEEDYTFMCKGHYSSQVEAHGITTANQHDKDCLHNDTLRSISLDTCRAAMTMANTSGSNAKASTTREETEFKWKPNYVFFEGHYYHISRFLSLNEGKVYRADSSRMGRWMATSQQDFYDKVHQLLTIKGKSTSVAVHGFAVFYEESTDSFSVGKVIRLVKTMNYQKSYVCFECDIDPKSNIEVCINLFHIHYKTDSSWEGKLSKDIIWMSMKHLALKLDNFGKNAQTIALKKNEIDRLIAFQKAFKQTAKSNTVKSKRKVTSATSSGEGNTQDTVCIKTLKTILSAQNIEFPSNCTSLRVLVGLLKTRISSIEPPQKKGKSSSFSKSYNFIKGNIPGFSIKAYFLKLLVNVDREWLLFDPYIHKWYILYLLVIFLPVYLSGFHQLQNIGVVNAMLQDFFCLVGIILIEKIMVAELLLQLILMMLRVIWIIFRLAYSIMLARINIEQFGLPTFYIRQ